MIADLSTNLSSYDIALYPPATKEDLLNFERKLRSPIPEDFKAFYLFCNGFESAEDLFRIIPLSEIADDLSKYKPNCFAFAEYMIYSDMWEIKINPSKSDEYRISNHGLVFRDLTDSFGEFLNRFLTKGVFEEGGFYTWHDQVDAKNKS